MPCPFHLKPDHCVLPLIVSFEVERDSYCNHEDRKQAKKSIVRNVIRASSYLWVFLKSIVDLRLWHVALSGQAQLKVLDLRLFVCWFGWSLGSRALAIITTATRACDGLTVARTTAIVVRVVGVAIAILAVDGHAASIGSNSTAPVGVTSVRQVNSAHSVKVESHHVSRVGSFTEESDEELVRMPQEQLVTLSQLTVVVVVALEASAYLDEDSKVCHHGHFDEHKVVRSRGSLLRAVS